MIQSRFYAAGRQAYSKIVRRNVRRDARRHGRVRLRFTDRAAPGSATPATGAALPTVGGQLEDTHHFMNVLKVDVCDDRVRVRRSLDAILT